MTATKITLRLALAVSAMLLTTCIWAQASPADSATGKINGATISIKYSSPSVKGRPIWNALVPYGKIWRAGANTATSFTTDKDIKVEGQTLPAGKYSLYALVNENEWTMIFNSQSGQWGITRAGETTDDPTKDVIKVKVKPVKSASMNERLVYVIDSKGFSLRWENLEVPVSIK
jgi:hypothetical protein